jgi:sec-independent protein translocase protein TatB
VLRTLGQGMAKVRRMASEFQGQFHEAMREAEMQDIKKQVDELGSATRDFTSYDPLKHSPFEPKAETTETPALPAAEEVPALPAPAETSATALPEPDLGAAEAPKPVEGRSS